MSRYCAKPTCPELATTWFEMSREEQRVVRADTSTKHAIPLCPSHADRFKVPAGWTLFTSEELAQLRDGSVIDLTDGASEPESDGAGDDSAGSVDLAAAWFMPAGSSAGQTPAGVAKSAAGTDDDVSHLANAAEGSMIDRAFNGPKARDRSTSDEPEEGSSDLYSTGEIPFPPHAKAAAI